MHKCWNYLTRLFGFAKGNIAFAKGIIAPDKERARARFASGSLGSGQNLAVAAGPPRRILNMADPLDSVNDSARLFRKWATNPTNKIPVRQERRFYDAPCSVPV